MIIGIPKEIMAGERRVSGIPETVNKMVASGHTVLVEKGAGDGAFYHDADYASAGATLLDDVLEIYKKADVIS